MSLARQGPELSIVVPTRNEMENVRALFDAIAAAMIGISYEVVVVDDSDDETPSLVRREASNGRPITLIHREGAERRGGLGTAVVCGLRAAKGQYIGSLDADLQHPPAVLRELTARLSTADLVVASRYIPGGSAGGLAGPIRRLGSLGARLLAQALLPRARLTSDPLGGFFALRREVVEDVDLCPIGFKILLEILVRGQIRNVVEVPYQFGTRHGGQSKASLREMRLYLRHLIRLRSRNGCSGSVSGS